MQETQGNAEDIDSISSVFLVYSMLIKLFSSALSYAHQIES